MPIRLPLIVAAILAAIIDRAEMAGSNIGWGAPRTHGEFLEIEISQATVSRYSSSQWAVTRG